MYICDIASFLPAVISVISYCVSYGLNIFSCSLLEVELRGCLFSFFLLSFSLSFFCFFVGFFFFLGGGGGGCCVFLGSFLLLSLF